MDFPVPPHNNLHELKYFTARYISSDAEAIRNRLLGEAGKWAVFGQSYGGVVVRKYIELYPEHVLVAFSHGSAKYNAIDVAVSTELNTSKRINDYFKKYPGDLELIKKIKYQLKASDAIASKVYKSSGKDIIDFLYIFFAINSDKKVHTFFESLDKGELSVSFLKGISPIAQVVLDAGKIDSVISHIDLMDGVTDKIISKEVRKRLSKKLHLRNFKGY